MRSHEVLHMSPAHALATLIPHPSAQPSNLMSAFLYWKDVLVSENRSPLTIESYRLTLATFDGFLAERGHSREVDEITKADVQAFIADQLGKHSAGTANTRFAGVRAFFSFASDSDRGDIIDTSPMAGMRAPSMPTNPVPVLSIDDMRQLLDACAGKSLSDRRDTAIIRLLIDTGLRRAEVMGLRVADVMKEQHLLTVRAETAKGKKGRIVPYGTKAAIALQKYLMVRRSHRYASSEYLWISQMGPRMDPPALNNMLAERTRAAGLPHVHPHQFRHTAAHMNLKAGMGETQVQCLFGWSSPEMLNRYGAAAADERAREAYFTQGAPGDLV